MNAAVSLPACLDGLVPFAIRDRIELLVVDGGSSDETVEIARRHGARVITSPPGRGLQLAAGARSAQGRWLLFVHADTVLDPRWPERVLAYCSDPRHSERAASFRFALDDDRAEARRLEAVVAWRTRALGLPYGDQGLLISKRFYEAVGGFRPVALMEDVDIVRRIGRRRLDVLDLPARTSALRYRDAGYLRRSGRNLLCLSLYFLGLPPRLIARIYR